MNAKKTAEKLYVLDTNILIHDPKALFNFEGAHIGIPATVLEELDTFKREGTDRGRSAREVIRQLDDLRSRGSLADGVRLENGSTIKILFVESLSKVTSPFKMNVEDNEILLTAVCLKDKGYHVIFVSKDLNARVKADVLGLEAQDYIKEHITEEAFYKGWITIQVPSIQLKKEVPEELIAMLDDRQFTLNEFVLAASKGNPYNYRIFRYLGGKRFKAVLDPQLKWPLRARNPQQLMALDLLMDDSIKLISLLGPAGTGKTFLALLAGLHKVLVEDEYQKILISRPVIPLGRDIGYLPGDMQEKLYNWMLPIYDNMEFIMHAAKVNTHLDSVERSYREEQHEHQHDHHKKKFKKNDRERTSGGLENLDDLVKHKRVSLEAITYMRGRSIPYQYILIDEVQNLTPHEVKTLVSRVGEGSKIILAGDPYQIDSPYLDFASNGLVITAERFKGQPLFGGVFLESSERSTLSKLAGELL